MTSVCTLVIVCALTGATPRTSQTVLLSFSSSRCGPCQRIRPTVEQLITAGYNIRQVDIDRERNLAERFGVSQVPCFVMVSQGQEVDRTVGLTTGQRLVAMFAKARGPTTAAAVPSRTAATVATTAPITVATTVATAAPTTVATRGPITGSTAVAEAPAQSDIERSLMQSTVRLRVDDPSGHSYGTGTIIYAQGNEALILTCGHIFRDSQGQGAISVDVKGSPQAAPLPAKLLSYDLKRDLGLVRIQPSFPVTASRLAEPGHLVRTTDRVLSIGCSNGGDATLERTRITGVDRYMGPPNFVAGGMPVEGRSGGGLFDESGRLIGVCFAADADSQEGVYAAIGSIYAELQRAGLTHLVHAPTAPQIAAVPTPPAVPLEPGPPAVGAGVRTAAATAGIVPPLTPALNRSPATPVATADLVVEMNDSERKAFAEIAKRSQTAEVICIVRPLGQPDSQSEVFVMERVSPEFVALLNQRRLKTERPLQHASVELPASRTRTPLLDLRHRQTANQRQQAQVWR